MTRARLHRRPSARNIIGRRFLHVHAQSVRVSGSSSSPIADRGSSLRPLERCRVAPSFTARGSSISPSRLLVSISFSAASRSCTALCRPAISACAEELRVSGTEHAMLTARDAGRMIPPRSRRRCPRRRGGRPPGIPRPPRPPRVASRSPTRAWALNFFRSTRPDRARMRADHLERPRNSSTA